MYNIYVGLCIYVYKLEIYTYIFPKTVQIISGNFQRWVETMLIGVLRKCHVLKVKVVNFVSKCVTIRRIFIDWGMLFVAIFQNEQSKFIY